MTYWQAKQLDFNGEWRKDGALYVGLCGVTPGWLKIRTRTMNCFLRDGYVEHDTTFFGEPCIRATPNGRLEVCRVLERAYRSARKRMEARIQEKS